MGELLALRCTQSRSHWGSLRGTHRASHSSSCRFRVVSRVRARRLRLVVVVGVPAGSGAPVRRCCDRRLVVVTLRPEAELFSSSDLAVRSDNRDSCPGCHRVSVDVSAMCFAPRFSAARADRLGMLSCPSVLRDAGPTFR